MLCCTRLVIDTLTEASKADPNRKCFRLIGGVLVERTVKEVLPALQTNLEGVSCVFAFSCSRIAQEWQRADNHTLRACGRDVQLKQILETLLKQYKQKESELQDFQREYAS